ncbi:hypothetical protein BMS3Abin13_00865 [bacterium BMS3Abin13]|nr:hypothetical protein BMS3Abin13_00865 [bacterium BMS3Abin13]
MFPTVYIQHRLYLHQLKFLKEPDFNEVVPLDYNYQNMIIVTSGRLSFAGREVVFQTSGCGCGPQPAIKGALLVAEVPWPLSNFRRQLAGMANAKDVALADQNIIPAVFRIKKVVSAEERDLVRDALHQHLGAGLIIDFF